MASRVLSMAEFLAVLVLLCSSIWCCTTESNEPSASLKIPASEFVEKVSSTIGIVRKVISTVSKFSGRYFGDFRQSNAVSDCLELMDLSMDQLSSTLDAYRNPSAKDNSTGNIGADMKTWLSAALTNQDTCRYGFDGTNGIVGRLISGSLTKITSLISDILSNVKTTSDESVPTSGGGRKLLGRGDEFPDWLSPRDRKLLQPAKGTTADVVVAADGSGNFTTIKKAVEAAPENSKKRFVIHVKSGVYKEYVEIGKKKLNIMLIGDGANATVISGNRNFVDGWTTYRSATFAVKGQGFIARDITFDNASGPEKHQAVAFRSDSDLSVLYRCSITGYQDTLYAHSQRQFYRECKISGTVDFIFGDAAAVFQKCEIVARAGLPSQKNTVTAQGRTDPVQITGFSIQACTISTEPGVPNSTLTYLGRPWKLYSRTVIMQSMIDKTVHPAGWLEWDGDFALDTLFYAEYKNYGGGSDIQNRVKWPGYHVFNRSDQVSGFTVSEFITGNLWLPPTGFQYTAGVSLGV